MARKILQQEAPPDSVAVPVRMEELFGHARTLDVVRRALDRGALAPSVLLTGPRGVGKATLARMVAAALLCHAPTPSACGACISCRKMAKGIHPDFRTVTFGLSDNGKPKNQIVIEDIREQVLMPLALPPYEGKKLVFLVDPADGLNLTCQNVLLKPLEEPPPYAQFLLVTTAPWKLLPTVRSRCQRLGLTPLGREEMVRWMTARGEPPEGERELALAWASGRPGRLSDFDPAAFRRRRRDLLDLIEVGLDASRAPSLLRLTDRLAKERPTDVLGEVSVLLTDTARALEGLPPRYHGDAAPELKRAALSRGPDGLRTLIERLSEAPAHLNHNVNGRLLFEWVFLTP